MKEFGLDFERRGECISNNGQNRQSPSSDVRSRTSARGSWRLVSCL